MELILLEEKHIELVQEWNSSHENQYIICDSKYGLCVTYSQEMHDYLIDAKTIGLKPTDKTITGVQYDWLNAKVYITIADELFPSHGFECTSNWTYQDCVDAIQNKYPD